MTITWTAPAASARSTSARTTWGSVVIPVGAGAGPTRFGLMTTVCPAMLAAGHCSHAETARSVAAYGSAELPTPTWKPPTAEASRDPAASHTLLPTRSFRKERRLKSPADGTPGVGPSGCQCMGYLTSSPSRVAPHPCETTPSLSRRASAYLVWSEAYSIFRVVRP